MWLSELDLKRMGLKSFGKECLISDKASIYGAEFIEFGDYCRIDDFCILSARKAGIKLGNYCHIACYTSLIGRGRIELKDFAGISGHCAVYSSTDSFTGQFIASPTIKERELTLVKSREIVIGKFVTIGCNSSLFASVGDNSAIGANSLVREDVSEGVICAGNPLKLIGYRKKDVYLKEKLIK